MKVLERLESRQRHWQELEKLCKVMEAGWRRIPAGSKLAPSAANVSRFAGLYRSACADLALADAYQLPPATIRYLHDLVGRAHNQLYRRESQQSAGWFQEVFVNVPQRLYADGCVRLAFVMFWSIFLLCLYLGWRDPDFATRIVGREPLITMERSFDRPHGFQPDERAAMSGFYIMHNGTIGLRCFAYGLLAGIGGLYETVFNASVLGAQFGYMVHTPGWPNMADFVTAHAPFELTAIVLMAAAGMRLGFSMIDTRGRGRADAMYRAARRSVPVLTVGVVLFALAAAIEAFVSPFPLPYGVKVGVAALSTVMLIAYFLVLGRPPRPKKAGGPPESPQGVPCNES
jgi:uncharacterized membrane protein SpoIIM required for sporulation